MYSFDVLFRRTLVQFIILFLILRKKKRLKNSHHIKELLNIFKNSKGYTYRRLRPKSLWCWCIRTGSHDRLAQYSRRPFAPGSIWRPHYFCWYHLAVGKREHIIIQLLSSPNAKRKGGLKDASPSFRSNFEWWWHTCLLQCLKFNQNSLWPFWCCCYFYGPYCLSNSV